MPTPSCITLRGKVQIDPGVLALVHAGNGIGPATVRDALETIGVGIDFAIHLTMRFRPELTAHEARVDALRSAAESTGTALVGSAATSIIGFAILAFAPMPMFAAFGLLTAVMIAMALAAALLVLPSLLMVVDTDSPPFPAVREPVDANAWGELLRSGHGTSPGARPAP